MKELVASADEAPREHVRSMGWIGTTALAMGGSNQSLFFIAALSDLSCWRDY